MLLRTLRSLERQSVAPERYEVIVGVDGSTDGTVAALAGLRPPYSLRWIFQHNRGAVAAANAAGHCARNDVLIVLGDDLHASPDLVAAHLEAHQRHGPVLVQGDYPLARSHGRSGASLVYERSRRAAMSTIVANGSAFWHLWGGNFSIRRQTWLAIGGWDEAFREYGGEDTDLGLRVAALGIPFVFEPRARAYHMHAVTPHRFAQHAFSEGRAMVRVARKHGLALEAFSGGTLRGPFDRCVARGWAGSSDAMDRLGRLLTAALATADLVKVRPAQVSAARLVRRFYRVGGITAEARGHGA